MQRSAWRPTWSASTSVRPLSISTRWNSCGPSPGRTPVQNDVYGFMRSPVDERGSSCRNTSMSRQDGTSFSMPITVTSTSGSVVHMRPLPSDSNTQTVPVSATAKLAPEIPMRADEELAPQVQPGRLGERRRLVGQVGQVELAREQLADLGAVLVDRRHEDVRLDVVAELDDQLRQVGLHRAHARPAPAPR